MGPSTLPPSVWVQLTQAMVARELVEEFGLAEREAARRIGIAPSAVSQYLSGKRLGPRLRTHSRDEGARRLARRAAQQLAEEPPPGGFLPVLLTATLAISRRLSQTRSTRAAPSELEASEPPPDLALRRALRARIRGEQVAVAECVRLAQRSRDELTRALFRQIASDSLRHAEIVASLGSYLDRGISRSVPSGVGRHDVERLIERERAAETSHGERLAEGMGGVMRLLWQSMEADERKHDELLDRLLELLPGGPSTPGRRARGFPRPSGPPRG